MLSGFRLILRCPTVGHLTIPGNTLAKKISFGLRISLVSRWNGWRMRLDCHIAALFRELSGKRVRSQWGADDHQLCCHQSDQDPIHMDVPGRQTKTFILF